MRLLKNHSRLLLLCFFLFCTLSSHAQSVAEIAKVDRLLAVLARRLELADGVAQAKWNSGSAIEDPEREEQVLQRFTDEASRFGLESELARRVMRAQMEASKVRQREHFRHWRGQRRAPFTSPPNLATEIRPQLDQISMDLLQSLRDTESTFRTYPELLSHRAAIVWGNRLSPAQNVSLEPFKVRSLR